MSDDGKDVLAEPEAELPGFVPGTFGELLGVSYDRDDYERHSWSRRLRMLDTAARCAQIAGSGAVGAVDLPSLCAFAIPPAEGL